MDKLKLIVELLAEGGNEELLRTKYHDHQLSSNSEWKGFRELHIDSRTGDWLLIYRIYHDDLVLSLVRTSSHKKLLGKYI